MYKYTMRTADDPQQPKHLITPPYGPKPDVAGVAYDQMDEPDPTPSPTPRPRLLDLFSGAGGAAKGYQRAGFHVTGIDINPQPNYCGDEFYQLDALHVLRDVADGGPQFDCIHASPPCQRYSISTPMDSRDSHPDLVAPVRALLRQTGLPYVIENVPGAPLESPVTLCGSMFGLGVRRHRLFETSFCLTAPPCDHRSQGTIWTVTGHANGKGRVTAKHRDPTYEQGCEAMGIDWMKWKELSQAIPPAYTEWIGTQLMANLKVNP